MELMYLWRIFSELFRGQDGIEHTEIKAYCDLTRTRLDPWEVKAIKTLDSLKRIEVAKRWKK